MALLIIIFLRLVIIALFQFVLVLPIVKQYMLEPLNPIEESFKKLIEDMKLMVYVKK